MEGLKLVIGGDVSAAIAAQKTLVKEVEKGADKIDSTYKKTFSSVASSIKTVAPATKPAIQAVSKLGDTIETLRAKLLAKQSFLVTETDIRKVAVLNTEIAQLQNEIIRVGNAGKVGFDNLGNAVTKAGGSFGGMAAGAQKGFSALRTLANIIPGIGIGGLVALLSEAVIGLFKTSQGFDEAAISAANFSQALKDAKSDLEGVFKADIDLTKLKNKLKLGEGASLLAANFEIDKTANQKIIDTANVEIDKVIDRIGQLRSNAAIFLSKKGQQLLDLFPVDSLIPDNLIDDLEEQDKKIIRELKVLGVRYESLSEERAKAFTAGQSLVVQNEIDLREALKKQQEKRLDDLKKFIDKAKQLASELEKIGFVAPAEFSFFDSFSEQLTKAKKVFADFNSGNIKLDTKKLALAFPITFTEPTPEKAKEALSTVEQAIKSGLIQLPPVEIPVEISPELAANATLLRDAGLAKAFKDLGKNAPVIDLEMPAGFNESVFIDSLRKFFGAGQDVTKEGLQQMAAEFRKGIDNINNLIKSLAVEGIAGFAESFGAALGGGDLRGIFNGFVNVLADGLSSIGKQMIALAPVIAGLKAALKSLNPAILLPAGIALVAIGAALRASLNKGITGFAQGGLVFGPTMGMVGEGLGTSRSNPEVIAPLDQLKGMLEGIGGGAQVVVVKSVLRGKDQILQNARTSRSQRRTVGR